MAFQNTILTTTTLTNIVSPITGSNTDILWLILTNTSSTGTRVDISNSGGGPTCSIWVPPTSTLPIFFDTGAIGGTVGGSWQAALSVAVTDIRIFVNYYAHP